MRILIIGAAAAACFTASAIADDDVTNAKYHAPIGVMGDHMHEQGEVMFSYRFMRMDMEGSRIGTDAVTPDEIATSVPNRFFGNPMTPPTLRVVPLDMTMDMHMLGAMYAPTDWLTLMVMGTVVRNSMDHQTYMGGMGATVLGGFNTKSSGFGDTRASALLRLMESGEGATSHHAHLNLGVSIPTGSIMETGEVLTPMNMTPTLRLPYPMQLGSGTLDLEPGITYTGKSASLSWGAQYKATLRTGTNDEGYRLGDRHDATIWAQYGPNPWAALSLRLAYRSQQTIDGIDPMIMAPVQTANPDFQGGDRIDVGVGLNLAGQGGAVKGHRFGIEFAIPVCQDLNGPQLETDWTLTAGWQKAF